MSNINTGCYSIWKAHNCIFLQSQIVRIILCFLSFLALFLCVQQVRAAIVIGNPKGSVTLDFVYDYQCIHCHHMFPVVQKLISKNPSLKVKLYPVAVLNHNSLLEAATAIAAIRFPGKFQELTTLLMYQPPLREPAIQVLLHQLGLDTHSFRLSTHSQWVRSQLLEGVQLLQQVHSTNIPVFIVSCRNGAAVRKVLVGEQNYNTLEGVIKNV